MSNDILNNFEFPPEAQRDFIDQGLQQKQLRPGVTEFQPQGSQNGIAHRFFIHAEKNTMKSEEVDMEINDEIEMVQFFKDRKNKPCHRVTELPDQLLRFSKKRINIGDGLYRYEFIRDSDGNLEVRGGSLAESYKAFKAGLGISGLPLERWERLSLAQVSTLKSEGIFTVQQFAALPVDRVEGRFPKDLIKAFNDAIHFCNAQDKKAEMKPYADELIALRKEVEELRAERASKAKDIVPKAPKKRRGRPKKMPKVEDELDLPKE